MQVLGCIESELKGKKSKVDACVIYFINKVIQYATGQYEKVISSTSSINSIKQITRNKLSCGDKE